MVDRQPTAPRRVYVWRISSKTFMSHVCASAACSIYYRSYDTPYVYENEREARLQNYHQHQLDMMYIQDACVWRVKCATHSRSSKVRDLLDWMRRGRESLRVVKLVLILGGSKWVTQYTGREIGNWPLWGHHFLVSHIFGMGGVCACEFDKGGTITNKSKQIHNAFFQQVLLKLVLWISISHSLYTKQSQLRKTATNKRRTYFKRILSDAL